MHIYNARNKRWAAHESKKEKRKGKHTFAKVFVGTDAEFWSEDNYQIVIVYRVQTH
jgi:hypothetical protein